LRLFSFGGYGLALAALALMVFGAIGCPPIKLVKFEQMVQIQCFLLFFSERVRLIQEKLEDFIHRLNEK